MLAAVPARILLILSLVVIVAIGALSAPVASAGRDRCAFTGAKVVKQNSQVRILRLTRRGVTRYYGCLRSTGRRVRVGSASSDPQSLSEDRVSRTLVAGTSVAVQGSSFVDIGPEGEENSFLVVADLRRGGRVYRVSVDTGVDSNYEGFATLRLRADGAATWALTAGGGYTEIDVLGPTARRPTPVAYAKRISTASLAFGGDGVTWLQDGATRTAAIP